MPPQTQPQYQAPLTLQTQPFQSIPVSQSYNTLYGQNYTNQPSHHDPWTSQRPQQNPNVPRSGGVIFDPETDGTMDYSSYVNIDVNHWTNNNTDPNYLVSPNAPRAPPHELTYNSLTQYPPQTTSLASRPALPRVIVPPQPQYLNHSQPSGYLGGPAMAEQQISAPSPSVSVWSTHGQFPSPNQLSTHSIPSPGGSDGMIPSYPASDQGIAPVQGTASTTSDTIVPYVPTEHNNSSPTKSGSELAFDTSPEPEPSRPGPRRTTSGRGSGRPGGRALGTHLEPRVAKAAHEMRRTVACWHCVLQRDKVRIWIPTVVFWLSNSFTVWTRRNLRAVPEAVPKAKCGLWPWMLSSKAD